MKLVSGHRLIEVRNYILRELQESLEKVVSSDELLNSIQNRHPDVTIQEFGTALVLAGHQGLIQSDGKYCFTLGLNK
jgi:hypothetical protein